MQRLILATALISCAATRVALSRADDAGTPGPPSVAASKPRMSASDSAGKREGMYATGIPVVDSDPDTGFGLGAVAEIFWDGPRTDPLFDYAPYRHRLLAGAVIHVLPPSVLYWLQVGRWSFCFQKEALRP